MPRKKKSTKVPENINVPSPRSQMHTGESIETIQQKQDAWNTERKRSHRRSGGQIIPLSPGNVIRNQFFSGDGTDPVESLQSLQEIFRGKLEKDVVQLVFSECGYNVEQTLENLLLLMPETEAPERKDPSYKMQQPTTSGSGMAKNISKHTGNPLGLRGGGTEDGIALTRLQTFPGTKNYTWNTISVSSDSSSDSTSTKDYNVSDIRRLHMSRQHYADVICHSSDRDRSGNSSNTSVDSISSEVNRNLSATGFSFSVNSETKAVDSIFSSKNAIDDAFKMIHDHSKVLIILRGLPGSGKSTLSRQLRYGGVVFSTDDYYYSNNVYKFDPTLLTEAHEWNKARAHSALEDAITPVIIDNTNIEGWHMKPYVVLGIKFNYKIVILEPNTLWKFNVSELARRNTHGVTKESISRMLERYEHGITVESFGLEYAKNCSLNSSNGVYNSEPVLYRGSPTRRAKTPDMKLTKSHSGKMTENLSFKLDVRSSTPELQSKKSDSSVGSKTSISSENVENSSTSSQNSEGLKATDHQHLELSDLMALTLQESEDSLSISRRTSASSSQDTSGWEHDEEFLWSGEDTRLHSRHSPLSNISRAEDIIEEPENSPCEDDILPSNQQRPTSNSALSNKSPEQYLPQQDAIPAGSPSISTQQPEKPSDSTSSLLSSDWSIPSYPMTDKTQSRAAPSELNISLVVSAHSATQTSTTDYLELYSINSSDSLPSTASKILIGRLNPNVWKDNLPVPTPNPQVPILATFDKSTTTDDLGPDLDKENKLGMLQGMFPSISLPDLEDILDKCHGDHDWAVNILIDFGQEFNDQNAKLAFPGLPRTNRSPPVGDEKPDVFKEVNVTQNVVVEKVTQNITCDRLMLSLEPAFAMQLEEMFGTVGFRLSPGSLSAEDLQVSVDSGLARQIHALWRKTLCNRFAPSTPNPPNGTSAAKEKLLNGTVAPPGTAGPQGMSLDSIMAMETALEAKRQEMLKAPNNNADALATKLGRIKLYDLFPGIDRTALDEMYEANNCKLSLTLLCLRETLGDGASGGPWLDPQLVKETEEELTQIAAQASVEGQLETNWRTWVSSFPVETEEAFVPSLKESQPVEGYDQLRAEALLHHKMQQECIGKSSVAYQRGMKAVASFYSQQGQLHHLKLREANQRAADKILELRNVSLDRNCLDLHGLYVSEALKVLHHFLEQKKEELQVSALNRLVLSVITGRGLHSTKAGPKLKPAVLQFLQKENHKFEMIQEGLFKVVLT